MMVVSLCGGVGVGGGLGFFFVIPCPLECYPLLVLWEPSSGHLRLVLILCISLVGAFFSNSQYSLHLDG